MNPIKINSTSRNSVVYHLSSYIMDQTFILENKVPMLIKPIKDINDMIDMLKRYSDWVAADMRESFFIVSP